MKLNADALLVNQHVSTCIYVSVICPLNLLCVAGEEVVAPSPGGGQGVHVVARQQTFFEAMRGFLLQHFLADADMAAEMQAGRGAAHYDMEHYTVRVVVVVAVAVGACRSCCWGSMVGPAGDMAGGR